MWPFAPKTGLAQAAAGPRRREPLYRDLAPAAPCGGREGAAHHIGLGAAAALTSTLKAGAVSRSTPSHHVLVV